MKLIRTAMIALIMILTFGTISAYGTVDKNDTYGYTVTFYAGLQGHFGSDSNNKTVTKKCNAGEEITISLSDLDFHLDNKEYYAKGLRLTGHDNDEWSDINAKRITVEEDMAFEVAYGLKGGMVAYTVNYVSAKDGAELHPSDTYYGMVGDKPVVSYKYVENYLPDAYNKGKRLTSDESQNVYTFTYTYTGGQSQTAANSANGAAATGNNGTGNAAGQNAAGVQAGNTANIEDNAAPQPAPKEYVDIDNPEAPLADGADSEGSGMSKGLIAGIAAVIAAIAAAAAFFARRRSSEEE